MFGLGRPYPPERRLSRESETPPTEASHDGRYCSQTLSTDGILCSCFGQIMFLVFQSSSLP